MEVLVNVLDPSNLLIKSESQTFFGIPAGATYYAGGMVITDSQAAKLEITVRTGKAQKKSLPATPPVSNVRVVDQQYGGTQIFAEIANPYTKPLSSTALVTFVCFDAGGNVIGGGYGYPGSAIPVGGRIAFERSVEGLTAAQIASVQVSVEPTVDN